MSKFCRKWLFPALIPLAVAACGSPNSDSGGSSNTNNEASFCTPNPNVVGVIVTGSAVYQRRAFITSQPYGLGNADAGHPIRHAEVQIYSASDPAKKPVQCGETDASGNFSLNIPSGAGSYIVSVNSRANDNSFLRASVLTNPTDNAYYSLTGNISVASGDTTKNAGILTATVDGRILGGAFNILDVIHRANDFFRSRTQNCAAKYPGCRSFSVAPKVYTYWTPGFNPGVYVGTSSGLSFYMPGTSQLYILGGSAGDSSATDTDHFDDNVIAHEYGHFIEDVYARTDNPGGSHDANSIADARLAWGEGWADFVGLAVNGSPIYHDTVGYNDTSGGTPVGSTFAYFYIDLEHDTLLGAPMDVPTAAGEGNFHEFAVTRALWDFVDDPGDIYLTDSDTAWMDNVHVPFDDLWAIFGNEWKKPQYHFRNYGLFTHLYNTLLTNPVDMSAAMVQEKQNANASGTKYYGKDPTGLCLSSVSITPSGDTTNQYADNDFYTIQHSGGVLTIEMAGVSGPADLDLYVYTGDRYHFGDTGSMVTSSVHTNTSTEKIETSLAAGVYMLNVNSASAGTGGTTLYSLTISENGKRGDQMSMIQPWLRLIATVLAIGLASPTRVDPSRETHVRHVAGKPTQGFHLSPALDPAHSTPEMGKHRIVAAFEASTAMSSVEVRFDLPDRVSVDSGAETVLLSNVPAKVPFEIAIDVSTDSATLRRIYVHAQGRAADGRGDFRAVSAVNVRKKSFYAIEALSAVPAEEDLENEPKFHYSKEDAEKALH